RVSESEFGHLLHLTEVASPRDSLYHISGSPVGSLAIGRKIHRFPLGKEHIGYIFVFVSDSILNRNILREVSFGGGGIMLLSADGIVLAGNITSPGTRLSDTDLFTKLIDAANSGSQSFNTEADGAPSLVVFNQSQQNDAYLLAAIPVSYINEAAAQTGQNLVLAVAAATILGAVIAMLIYRSIARTRLADQRRKRELELAALQYQINPHFLFNTLNSLKWVAVINDAHSSVSEGITSLSKLLKNVLLSDDEMIPLHEELDNLAHYLTIQKIRYAGCFEVVSEIGEDVADSLIPRFILQPLVENAVLHGTEGGERRIVITVRCERTDNGVLLEIKDNGGGFDSENIKDSAKGRFSGIGLSNVDERLKLYFGDGNGLEILSGKGEGTVCRVIIPNSRARAVKGRSDV
ncbi:MAG: histidine kinase, partial [Defluviitaleaceae bacterium]|nr:histidine kinase [Defluviitaleaceae bacterium]